VKNEKDYPVFADSPYAPVFDGIVGRIGERRGKI
jgi:hypothetical protein